MPGMIEKKVKIFLDKIKKENKKLNAFLEVRDEKELLEEARELDRKKGKKGKLYGKIIAVKSNINVLGLKTSCASKTLENYKATYDATVIKKIKAEDGLIIGMTNCDEFAAGSSGENSAFGVTINPILPGHVPGGSSSGSAAAVAAGFCDMALGSDTGGSIRVPASFCDIVGVKPSYGAVSRYGLVDLSMSLDQIGPLAKSVDEATLLLNVIKGKDSRDTKTIDSKPIKISKFSERLNLGIVRIKGVNDKIQALIDETVEKIVKEKKWITKNINIKYIDLAVQTYHILVWTEFFSATRRFDGRKYGKKIEEVAGREVLKRIIGGSEIARSEYAGRYYHKALKVKKVVKKEFERFFEKGIDCLIMPTVPILPWKIGEITDIEKIYATDSLVIPANLAGVCSISIPVGKIDGKPVGMQVMCGKGEDDKMMGIAREIEKLI